MRFMLRLITDINWVLKIKKACLYQAELLFLVLPSFIFFAGWLSPVYAIISCTLLFVSVVSAYKMIGKRTKGYIELSVMQFGALVAGASIIVFLSGIGGFNTQMYDFDLRNAMFRDLIELEWPVVYEQNLSGLCYYIGYYLPAVLIAKLAGFLGAEDAAWAVGNLALTIYSIVSLILILLFVMDSFKITWKNLAITVGVFVCFGGLAIIGYKLGTLLGLNTGGQLDGQQIEHYARDFVVSNGNYLMLANVFNQVIPAWGGLCLFLKLRKEYALYGIMAFSLALTAPLPCVGLVLLMIFGLLENGITDKKIKLQFLLSPSNILSCILVCIIFLYYKGNSSAEVYFKDILGRYSIFEVICFTIGISILNYGCYLVGLGKYREDFVLKLGAITLPVFYFVTIGGGLDFSMRTIVPFNFFVMIKVIECLVDKDINHKVYLAVLLTISAMAPFLNLSNQLIAAKGHPNHRRDNLYTLRDKNVFDYPLYNQYAKGVTGDIFFQHLCGIDTKPEHPIIHYINHDDVIIKDVILTRDLTDEFEAILPDDSIKKLNTISKSDIETYGSVRKLLLEDYEIHPLTQQNMTKEPLDITIEWENLRTSYKKSETIHADLLIRNNSSQVIVPGSNAEGGITRGINIWTIEKDGKDLQEQLAYRPINCYIYPDDIAKIFMSFKMPDEEGHYKIQIHFYEVQQNVSQYLEKQIVEYEFDIH